MAKAQRPPPGPFAYIGALLPLVYFGGMIYHFSGVGGGTIQGIVDIGLGPTVAGLSLIGLLFTIKPVLMVMRLLMGTPTAAKQGSAAPSPDESADSAFDADDAIARYLAKRSSGAAEPIAAQSDPQFAPQPRAGFGRKSV